MMRFSLPVVFGLIIFAARVATFCNTPPPSDFLKSVHQAAQANSSTAIAARGAQVATIQTFVHVVRQDNTIAGGTVPVQWIRDQINVLNQRFAPSGFSFVLHNIFDAPHPPWRNVVMKSKQELEMKRYLRKGSYNALNLYIDTIGYSDPRDKGLLGYATFPGHVDENGFLLDGVVLHPDTLPGGPLQGYNLGIIGVHEVGHWLGLFHTFQGGCQGQGDYVKDTPAERSPSTGCPTSDPSSCPGSGPNPIHNYMDYTNNACMNQFTPGQMQRMRVLWHYFRANSKAPYQNGVGEVIEADPGGLGKEFKRDD